MKIIARSALSARLDSLTVAKVNAVMAKASPEERSHPKMRKMLADFQGWTHGQGVSREQAENSLAWAMGFTVIDEGKI